MANRRRGPTEWKEPVRRWCSPSRGGPYCQPIGDEVFYLPSSRHELMAPELSFPSSQKGEGSLGSVENL